MHDAHLWYTPAPNKIFRRWVTKDSLSSLCVVSSTLFEIFTPGYYTATTAALRPSGMISSAGNLRED